MTNKEIKEAIFNELAERNFQVTDSTVGNGYYLFNFGDESVVHFRIKGCKRWLWGMWILHNEKEKVTHIDLFGEHDDRIDKFKPTQTAIAVETDISDDSTEMECQQKIENVVWDLIYRKLGTIASSNVAGKIKFYYDDNCGVIKWLLSEWWFYRIKYPFQNWLKYSGNGYVCAFICFLLNLIYGKRLKAEYKKTDYFSPVYEVYVRYKKGTNDDQIWDVYKHICSNVGFDKSIRIEHIPYGEKRGICFRTKELD